MPVPSRLLHAAPSSELLRSPIVAAAHAQQQEQDFLDCGLLAMLAKDGPLLTDASSELQLHSCLDERLCCGLQMIIMSQSVKYALSSYLRLTTFFMFLTLETQIWLSDSESIRKSTFRGTCCSPDQIYKKKPICASFPCQSWRTCCARFKLYAGPVERMTAPLHHSHYQPMRYAAPQRP